MEKLNPKDYQKQEKQFMCFGSLCNSLQNVMTEQNKEKLATWAWEFAQKNVGEFMDELYQNNESKENDEIPF